MSFDKAIASNAQTNHHTFFSVPSDSSMDGSFQKVEHISPRLIPNKTNSWSPPAFKASLPHTSLHGSVSAGSSPTSPAFVFNSINDYYLALINGDLMLVEDMIASSPGLIFELFNKGMTPLHLAVIQRHYRLSQFLINSKADVNAADDDGETPLHYAVKIHNDQSDEEKIFSLITLLLRNGADAHMTSNKNLSPIDDILHNRNGGLLIPFNNFHINWDPSIIKLFSTKKDANKISTIRFLFNDKKIKANEFVNKLLQIHFTTDSGLPDLLKLSLNFATPNEKWVELLNQDPDPASKSIKLAIIKTLPDNPEIPNKKLNKHHPSKLKNKAVPYEICTDSSEVASDDDDTLIVSPSTPQRSQSRSSIPPSTPEVPKKGSSIRISGRSISVLGKASRSGSWGHDKAVRSQNSKRIETAPPEEILHDNIINSQIEIVHAMLLAHPKLISIKFNGIPHLHAAAEKMNALMINKLIEWNANVNERDEAGNTPLDIIITSPDLRTRKEDAVASINALLENKADPALRKPHSGKTPVHQALATAIQDIVTPFLHFNIPWIQLMFDLGEEGFPANEAQVNIVRTLIVRKQVDPLQLITILLNMPFSRLDPTNPGPKEKLLCLGMYFQNEQIQNITEILLKDEDAASRQLKLKALANFPTHYEKMLEDILSKDGSVKKKKDMYRLLDQIMKSKPSSIKIDENVIGLDKSKPSQQNKRELLSKY